MYIYIYIASYNRKSVVSLVWGLLRLAPTIPYHPYHTIPYHTIPYHTIPSISYHTIHIIPYHTIPYHPYHTIPSISYHTIPYHTIPYKATVSLIHVSGLGNYSTTGGGGFHYLLLDVTAYYISSVELLTL